MADSIKKLTDLFSQFPAIGKRTANRFVFYLMKLPKEKIDELTSAILELKNKTRLCSSCFNPYEGESDLCEICQSASRDKQLLCIVQKEADLISIENAKKYKGLYFVVGDKDIEGSRIENLKEKIKNSNFKEIIIATNPTPEGKSASILIEKNLKDTFPNSSFRITHLAQGLPVGGELEYADRETLESAFEGRK